MVRLAREKADAVAVHYPDGVVLGADTTVVIDGQIVGKPLDLDDARRMLRLLSGRWHEVLTGVAVAALGKTRSAMQRTRVKFAEMDEEEIEFRRRRQAPGGSSSARGRRPIRWRNRFID